jgi:hypothetical protein
LISGMVVLLWGGIEGWGTKEEVSPGTACNEGGWVGACGLVVAR